VRLIAGRTLGEQLALCCMWLVCVGKAFEDKRGESVTASKVNKSWLYLNGRSVTCTRHVELAAMVSSINPSTTNGIDNELLSTLQQVYPLVDLLITQNS